MSGSTEPEEMITLSFDLCQDFFSSNLSEGDAFQGPPGGEIILYITKEIVN